MGFHQNFPVNLSPPLNQKRRTLRTSENSVLIPLTTPSIKKKTRLSKSQADVEEMNGHCDWFILSLEFGFRLRQSGFQRIVNDGVTSGVRGENGNVLILPTLIPSLTPLTTPIFVFCHRHSYDSSYDSDAGENQPFCDDGYTFFGGAVKFKKININQTNKSRAVIYRIPTAGKYFLQ